MTDEPRRHRWERRAEWPLTVLALAFLIAYALPILRPEVSSEVALACEVVTWVAWSAFALDYAVRLALSQARSTFVRENVFDLLVIVLPLMRPLRLLRLVTLLLVLNRHVGGSLRGRVAVYVAGATGLVLLVAALAVLDAERRDGVEPNITTFGDALWWSLTTVTTVGYGDRFPTSDAGRFVAGGLMLAGIALLGIVTASFASWLLERVREVEQDAEAATSRDIKELRREIRELRDALDQQQSNPADRSVVG